MQINQRLKKKSPWFQSILDPMKGADCKIPDETGVETGTLQLIQRATVTANANGVCGLRVISPYVNSVNNVDLETLGRNFQDVSPTATGSTITWGGGPPAGWIAGEGYPFDGVDEFKAITNAHRIVSAEILVQPETSLATNKGEYCLFSTPFAVEGSPIYSDYLNLYKSVAVPVNVNKAGSSRWFPLAREDLNFKSFMSTVGDTLSYVITDVTATPYWGFGFVTDGVEEDATFRVTMIVNYEFIPTFNTLNILDATPSPQDATETDLVENWVQEMPVNTIESQTKASSSPSSVTPQHGENDSGTGFGMFFNVISELAPLALALL